MLTEYMAGYTAGLKTNEPANKQAASQEYLHGFGDALYDLLDVTEYIDS
jgi:hypothetical protein